MNKNDDQQSYEHFRSEEQHNQVNMVKESKKKKRPTRKKIPKLIINPRTKRNILSLKKATEEAINTLEGVK